MNTGKQTTRKGLMKIGTSLLLLSMVAIAFSGCGLQNESHKAGSIGSTENSVVSPSATATESSKPSKTASPADSADAPTMEANADTDTDTQITPSGGLGDSSATFEKSYGEDANNDETMGSYQNSYIFTLYSSKYAYNVTLGFEATDKERRTLDEALIEAINIIPKDAVETKKYDLKEQGKYIVEYQSKKLAIRCSDFYKSDPDLGIKAQTPGTFLVEAKYDQDGVFSVIAALGTNP